MCRYIFLYTLHRQTELYQNGSRSCEIVNQGFIIECNFMRTRSPTIEMRSIGLSRSPHSNPLKASS